MGLVTCPACRKQVPVSTVRYVRPDEYVCSSCKEASGEKVSLSTPNGFDATPGDKKELLCDNCGFSNTVSRSTQEARCGYCGSSSLRSSGSAAAELLAEADSVDTTE